MSAARGVQGGALAPPWLNKKFNDIETILFCIIIYIILYYITYLTIIIIIIITRIIYALFRN
jgi:hypothetical protein